MKRMIARQLSVSVQQTQLIHSIDMELEAGEMVGLIGPNGAGKSTLLKSLGQLQSYHGHVRLEGIPVSQIAKNELARRVAYLAQGEQVSWPLSVRDFVALGRLPHQQGWSGFARSNPADQVAIDEALNHTDLLVLQQRPVSELSGGERARARLARALAVQAEVLLADEPVAALDPFHQLSVMNLLRQQSDQGRSVVVVLHDLTLASRYCNRLVLMHHGRIVASGEPRRVLTPKHLQQVYKVRAMVGEHQQQPFIVPWMVDAEGGAIGDVWA